MTKAVMTLLMAAATSVLLVLVPQLPASAVPGTLDTQSKFVAFWSRFKTAVAKQDAQTVASMTQLPFTVDNKPSGRAEFIRSYSKLFRGLEACIAQEKPIKDGQSYMLFCGDQGLFFKEVEGEYKFVEFFAND